MAYRILFILAFVITPVWAQSVALETETTRGQSRERGVMYVLNNKVRVDYTGTSNNLQNSMIFDGGAEVAYFLNHAEKTYTRMDHQTIKQMSGQMNQAMEEAGKQLAQLPPEQRKRVEEMMKGKMPQNAPQTNRQVRSNGGSKSIEGYSCKGYDVVENGRKVGEIWTTEWSSIAAADVSRTFQKMGSFFNELVESVKNNSMMRGQNNMMFGWDQITGLPILVTTLEGDKVQTQTRVLPSKRSVSSDLFVLPPYKEQSMFSR